MRRRARTPLPARPAVLLGLLLLPGLPGCGGEGIAPERVAEIRAALETDPSRALTLVHAESAGDDVPPRVALLGAEACLRLERRDDALAWVERGLQASGLDEALECELLWAQGAALVGRYADLSSDADRRLANSVLERATETGPRAVDAAFLLVLLQELGGRGDDERQLRYARLFLAREPDGPRARQVRQLLEAKGLSP
jgi:hypothetical protein